MAAVTTDEKRPEGIRHMVERARAEDQEVLEELDSSVGADVGVVSGEIGEVEVLSSKTVGALVGVTSEALQDEVAMVKTPSSSVYTVGSSLAAISLTYGVSPSRRMGKEEGEYVIKKLKMTWRGKIRRIEYVPTGMVVYLTVVEYSSTLTFPADVSSYSVVVVRDRNSSISVRGQRAAEAVFKEESRVRRAIAETFIE